MHKKNYKLNESFFYDQFSKEKYRAFWEQGAQPNQTICVKLQNYLLDPNYSQTVQRVVRRFLTEKSVMFLRVVLSVKLSDIKGGVFSQHIFKESKGDPLLDRPTWLGLLDLAGVDPDHAQPVVDHLFANRDLLPMINLLDACSKEKERLVVESLR